MPIDDALVVALREHRAAPERPGEGDLVFTATDGAYLHASNLPGRVLTPAAEGADPAAGSIDADVKAGNALVPQQTGSTEVRVTARLRYGERSDGADRG